MGDIDELDGDDQQNHILFCSLSLSVGHTNTKIDRAEKLFGE
jgi:hypothetical protein